MKFKVEIEVPDFPSAPMPVEASRISQLLGYIGCSAISYVLDHHNDMCSIAEPVTRKVVGHYWIEDGLTKAEKEKKEEAVATTIRDYKVNREIGDFFASKKKQKGKV